MVFAIIISPLFIHSTLRKWAKKYLVIMTTPKCINPIPALPKLPDPSILTAFTTYTWAYFCGK